VNTVFPTSRTMKRKENPGPTMNQPNFPGAQDVGKRIRQSPHLLLGLDYDGTLTPIVDEPAHALLPTPMRQALWALTRRDDVAVAVVSGRAHADLQELVGIPGVIYVGNHGMEISGPGTSFVEPGAKAASRELHILAQDVARRLQHIHGAFVEDKGLTLSVHHRRVAPVDAAEVCHTVHDVVNAHSDRFHVTPGNKVLEIRPLLCWNKGAAIRWIKEQLGKPDTLVVYLGDDTTDEDAFRLIGDDAVTIKVGDIAGTAARFLLSDPAAVQQFLQWVSELRDDKSSRLWVR
jgi:trehalose 6-phosphate phosphatase